MEFYTEGRQDKMKLDGSHWSNIAEKRFSIFPTVKLRCEVAIFLLSVGIAFIEGVDGRNSYPPLFIAPPARAGLFQVIKETG